MQEYSEFIVEYMFPIFFGIAIVVMIIGAVVSASNKKEAPESNQQEILGMVGSVVDKQETGLDTIADEVWVMFEAKDGKQMRLWCRTDHGLLVGDKGYIKYRGTRLVDFEQI